MMKLLLSLALCGALALPTSAQTAPQNAPQNGYETLIAAGKLLLPGENGPPIMARREQAVAENLRRQRLAVARNAPALKLLREALQLPVNAPAVRSVEDLDFAQNSSFRALARQLIKESDVRLADGDIAGALDSRLTGIELGAAITRGAPLVGALTGSAIEAVERQNFAAIALKLDAPQIRTALARLKASDARRATYRDVWQVEKANSSNLLIAQMAGLFDPQQKKLAAQILSTPAGLQESGMTAAQVQEMLALTPDTLQSQISATFEALIARDELPFGDPLRTRRIAGLSPLMAGFADSWNGLHFRFNFERDQTANRLFEAALELRAIQLETGAYPLQFATPIDPFSDGKPLIYQRDGDKPFLYSVGPDGRDDGGIAFVSLVTDGRTGRRDTTPRLTETSTGDILAPVF